MAADSRVIFSTELDESGIKKGLAGLKNSVGGLGTGIGAALGTLGAGLAAGMLAGASAMVNQAISTASDLQEVQNVVDTTFGKSAGRINEWAKSAKEAYGMSELSAKRYTSTIGAMFKSMGLAGEEVLDMSKGIAGLTGDMASFYNLDYSEAFDKLRAGISGETEPLKQLGINMSVANLQAYALSKGITKTYEKMTQAEQATLRYGYLMQVTADAQGDFARTSEGYANQQRILQTTQEELAATIGEVLLPIAIEATKALNEFVGGLGSAVKWVANLLNPPKSELDNQINDAQKAVNNFNTSIETAGQNLNTNLAAAKATQATAMSLLGNYEKINQKNVLTAQDTAQLKTIAQQIVALYPDMGKAIDATTGLFNINTGAIKNNITSLANQQQAMAFYAGTQEYQAALVKATVVQQQAQNAYADAWSDWQQKNTFAQSLTAMRSALQDGAYNQDVLEQFAGALISLSPEFAEFFEIAENGSYKLTKLAAASNMTGSTIAHKLNTQVAWYSDKAAVANDNTVALGKSLTTAKEATGVAQEGLDIATEAAKGLGETLLETSNGVERLTAATGSLPGGLTRVSNGLSAESAEAEKLRNSLASLSAETLKQIDSQVKGFEKINKVRPQSAKKTTANVNSQTKAMDDYVANLQKAKEKGVDPAALLELSDYTAENAAILAGLATAKDKEIASFNEAYAAREAERTEFAAIMAAEVTSLTEAGTSLATISDTAAANVAANAKTVTKTVADEAAKSKAAGELILQTANDVVTGVTTIAEDSATELSDAGSGMIDNVAGGISSNDNIKTKLNTKISDAVTTARVHAFQNSYSIGTNTVLGIAQGITDNGYKIKNALQTAIKDALDAIKIWSLINSPSKLFARELGAPYAEGIGYGFEKKMAPVSAEMMKAITASAQAGRAALDNTLLGRTLSASALAYPNVAALEASALKGSMLSGVSGSSVSNATTTVDARQTINFNQPMQAPDEVARAIRRINTYGLAGARV